MNDSMKYLASTNVFRIAYCREDKGALGRPDLWIFHRIAP